MLAAAWQRRGGVQYNVVSWLSALPTALGGMLSCGLLHGPRYVPSLAGTVVKLVWSWFCTEPIVLWRSRCPRRFSACAAPYGRKALR